MIRLLYVELQPLWHVVGCFSGWMDPPGWVVYGLRGAGSSGLGAV